MTPETSPSPELVEVHIIGLSLDAYRRTSEHNDELLREFALISQREPEGTALPRRLLQVMDQLQSRYGGFTAGQTETMAGALARGEETIDLVYRVPREVKQACVELDGLLDEVDQYCRAGDDLLTLATPPDAVAFRRWFLGEFVAQVDGAPPTPWPG